MSRSLRGFLGLATLLLLGLSASPAQAQIGAGDYAARRAALTTQIDSGVVLAFGAPETVSHWPSFFQLPAFYYLTGFSESDAVLLMVKRGGKVTATMFVPTLSAIQERWIGARTHVADLQTAVGVSGRDIGELTTAIDSLAKTELPFFVVPDVQTADYAAQDSLTRGARFLAGLRLAHPWLVARSLDDSLVRLRARKTPAEIALVRKAAEISARAHTEAMKAAGPGCGENEIQALLEGTFRR